MLILDN